MASAPGAAGTAGWKEAFRMRLHEAMRSSRPLHDTKPALGYWNRNLHRQYGTCAAPIQCLRSRATSREHCLALFLFVHVTVVLAQFQKGSLFEPRFRSRLSETSPELPGNSALISCSNPMIYRNLKGKVVMCKLRLFQFWLQGYWLCLRLFCQLRERESFPPVPVEDESTARSKDLFRGSRLLVGLIDQNTFKPLGPARFLLEGREGKPTSDSSHNCESVFYCGKHSDNTKFRNDKSQCSTYHTCPFHTWNQGKFRANFSQACPKQCDNRGVQTNAHIKRWTHQGLKCSSIASPAQTSATKPATSAQGTTAPGRISSPHSSVAAIPPSQATDKPSPAPGSKGTTPSVGISPLAATSISSAQRTTELPKGTIATSSATTQGSSTTPLGSVAVNQNRITTVSGQSPTSLGGSTMQTTPETRRTMTSSFTKATASSKPEGSPGTTTHHAYDKGSQHTPLSPGTSVETTATEVHPTQRGPPSGDPSNPSWFLTQTQFICEEAIPSANQAVVLTLNQSTPCDSLIKSPLGEPLLNTICKTVKPNFNRSQNHCLVRLAPVAGDPSTLAITGVSVQINAVADELFESLKIKEGELKKLGVNVSYAGEYPDMDSEDRFSMPLIITIVCMAASLLLAAAIYGCCHQRITQRKDQQRLTEELQTMENGYHDNPTLEVMETSSEMQEKKVNLNGELGDSWIVPMDNLTKEDLEEEEDTHL
ncbi:podocalyxin [Sphaerodactylus townsendi]|nr:podocalyxin [Sphaerodactylus townsendi]